MYLDHFGLREFPFRITPDPAFLFWTAEHHRAFDLLSGVTRGDVAVARVLGEPGTGKTTLLQYFAAGLPKDMQVGMISNYSSGLGGLGHWLHWAFALRPEGPEDELRAAFEAYLVARHHDGLRCLLIVDEAQNVSDEDIAALTDLTRLRAVPGRPSMQLVLAGQPGQHHRHVARRVGGDSLGSGSLRIGPMSPEDTVGYIRHRMAISGCQDEIFDDAATKRIAQLAEGVPRQVNVLCELLLTSAFGSDEPRIGTALVDRVVKDARQTGILDHLLSEPVGARPLAPSRTPAHLARVAAGEAEVDEGMPPVLPLNSPLRPKAAEPHRGAVGEKSAVRVATAPKPSAEPRDLPAPPMATVSIWRRHRHAALALIAAGGTAAAATFALVPERTMPPARGIIELQKAGVPAAVVLAPVRFGSALSAPPNMQGNDAAALHDQALIVGAQDPLAAAIGFARAALHGDARAAYYLGQHFEAGDGLPRNPALAAAWYRLAAKTQRSAGRALQNMDDAAAIPDSPASGQPASAPPRPLMGRAEAGGVMEFVWAAADDTAVRYLIELAQALDTPPQQHGPFDLSAVRLEPAGPASFWRVVSLQPDGARISASEWHLIDAKEAQALAAAP